MIVFLLVLLPGAISAKKEEDFQIVFRSSQQDFDQVCVVDPKTFASHCFNTFAN